MNGPKEQDYVPWAMALTQLDKWKEILQETSLVPELNYLLRHILTPMYNKGQLISECLFYVLNFPKKPTKNLTNFCPRI